MSPFNVKGLRGQRLLTGTLLVSAVIVAGCTEGDSGSVTAVDDHGGAVVSMVPPTPILAVRAIDRNALQLRVTVDGQQTQATPQDDGTWRVTVQIPRGREVPVEILWLESFGGQLLGLASAEKVGRIGLDADIERGQLVFRSSDFETGAAAFDADQDLISNLKERTDGTNPLDRSDPGEPVTTVVVPLEVRLPSVLSNVEELDIDASVDRQGIDLVNDDGVYRGNAVVSRDSSVFTEIDVFLAGSRLILAEFQRSDDSGEGNTIVVTAGDFVVDELDRDGDGLSNALEVADGSDPFVSDLDPCDVSQFALGCTTDTDQDGRPDSQEGEAADGDGDGIPDFEESRLNDRDDDGFSDEADRDNDDPCVPSRSNDACEAVEEPPTEEPPTEEPPTEEPPTEEPPTEEPPTEEPPTDGEGAGGGTTGPMEGTGGTTAGEGDGGATAGEGDGAGEEGATAGDDPGEDDGTATAGAETGTGGDDGMDGGGGTEDDLEVDTDDELPDTDDEQTDTDDEQDGD